MVTIENLFAHDGNSVKEVMQIIDRNGLGTAIIVDGQKILKGIVTDGDIRKALGKGIALTTPVREIMNTDPIKVMDGFKKEEIEQQIKKTGKGFSEFYLLKIPIVDMHGCVVNVAVYSHAHKTLYFIKEEKSSIKPDVKKVLIVGGAGYLGSILSRKLLKKGYKVRVLDILLFGEEPLAEIKDNPHFELIHGDIRDITVLTKALSGVDAVIQLAAIVGDPASKNQPEDTIEINYLATMTLAQACKYHQINRFIFASTCSVYGVADKVLDEYAELNPVSLYARSKIESERGILSLMDENFSPTILRMGTLYGLAPRMRFDLVVNIFAMRATTEKKISIFGGKQWRPLLHVADAADAYIFCIDAPIEKIRGQTFNVGSDAQNHRIEEIGTIVKNVLPDTQIEYTDKEIVSGQIDKRDYRVSFEKIKKILGFKVNYDVKKAIIEISEVIKSQKIQNVNDPKYYSDKRSIPRK